MGWRPICATAVTMVLAVSLGACSVLPGGSKDDSDPSESSSTTSSRGSATPTPSTSASPTESADAGLSGTGGSVLIVPADSPGAGRCSPAPRKGVVCSADGRTTYRFQPDAVRTIGVQRVLGENDKRNGWQIQLTATASGSMALAAVTRVAARTRQFALLLTPRGRRLITAPQVTAPITGGELQISGDFTEADARRLVRQVTSPSG